MGFPGGSVVKNLPAMQEPPGGSVVKNLPAMQEPPGGSVVKNLPAMQEPQETRVPSVGQEDPRRSAWQPTPVFLPGKSSEQRSLVGYI